MCIFGADDFTLRVKMTRYAAMPAPPKRAARRARRQRLGAPNETLVGVSVRFTPAALQAALYRAAQLGLDGGTYMRMCALEHVDWAPPMAPMPEPPPGHSKIAVSVRFTPQMIEAIDRARARMDQDRAGFVRTHTMEKTPYQAPPTKK